MDPDGADESSGTAPATEESSTTVIKSAKQAAASAPDGTDSSSLPANNVAPPADDIDQNTGHSPSHCLGTRAYDGGYFDVGSFFVFHHKPADSRREEKLAGTVADADRAPIPSAADSSEQEPSALGYVLLDGLTVKTRGPKEKRVEGSGSVGALRAFLELKRQADVIGQALGCPDPFEAEGTHGAGEVTENGVSREGEVRDQECLALSNTDNNESVQGLVRSAGCFWLGVFSLPPVPSGEEEEEIVDLWPRKVARFAEDGEAGVLPLEGRPDAVGPLTAPKGEGSESETIAGACKAYGLIARALAELRPFVPAPPDDPGAAPTASDQSPVRYVKGRLEGEKSDAAGTAANGDSGRALSLDGSNEEEERDEGEGEQEGDDAGKRPATTRAVSSRSGGRKSTPAPGKRRAGRKRRRVNMFSYERRSSLRGDRRVEEDEEEMEEEEEEGDVRGGGAGAEEQGDKKRGKRGAVRDAEEDREETRGDGDGIGVGAGEMTVAAVRASLLRNRSDERPSVEGEEWEDTVRRFIKHVESLPPGTTQEELSLMFAAALDPTLVHMRAANTSLISLAEACASRELGIQDEDEEDEDDDDENYGSSGGGRNRSGRDTAASSGGRGRGRFKVRLELDATEGDGPPPEGIAGLLRAVAGARAAVEATAKAEACVAAAGDTLGGLQELKADYKRSLPTGPREPIQLIIAEEQARVSGYSSAYDIIVRQRVEDLRAAGAKVGEAYRAVELELGWMSVKSQVDRFLRKFIEYSGFRLPNVGSIPDLLGLGRGAHQQWKQQ